jgi:hypothetical protein
VGTCTPVILLDFSNLQVFATKDKGLVLLIRHQFSGTLISDEYSVIKDNKSRKFIVYQTSYQFCNVKDTD